MVFRTQMKNSYYDEVILNEGYKLKEYWIQIKTEMIIKTIIFSLFFLPIGIFFLIRFFKMKKSYQEITELVEEGNQKEIISIIKDKRDTFEVITVMMCIYALADMKNDSLEEIIRSFLKDMEVKSTLRVALVKKRCICLLDHIEKSKGREKEKNEAQEEAETIIPITKIFFIEEEKMEGEKCMITGIRIDVEGDKIVACPKCGHFAKKDLLEKWLKEKEKEKCPICRNRITITDCPEVRIKETK